MPEISLFSGMVKLHCTKEEYRSCRNHIKKLLISSANVEIPEDLLEYQYKTLIRTILNLSYKPNKGFHLEWHRRGVHDFREKMIKLLPAIDQLILNDEADRNIEIILNLGTHRQPRNKHFKLPNVNDAKFLVEFKSFILDYYERNPVFKYYRGLDPKLSLDNINNLITDRRNKPLTEDISYKAIYYQPHRQLLESIRTFPQFNKKRKPNSVLINIEGELVIKLLSIIQYDRIAVSLAKDEYVEINGFNTTYLRRNISDNIKKLRNDLTSYIKAVDKYYSG